MRRTMLLSLFIAVLFSSCSGYRYSQQDNPLSQYGITSLSVPMFHNFSNQPEVAGDFTRETYRLLTGYSGLKLSSGYNKEADALMVGIIKSPERVSETLIPGNFRVAEERAGDAIGNKRQRFFIPGTSQANLYLQVIVIKKPTEEELALLKSGIGDQIKLTSKVIFNETLPLRAQYTREIFNKDGDINSVDITATQNEGVRRKTMQSMAEQAALSIRDMILYAF